MSLYEHVFICRQDISQQQFMSPKKKHDLEVKDMKKADEKAVKTEKNDETLDGLLTIGERDRLVKKMFPIWAKNGKKTKIAKLMQDIDPEKTYSKIEFKAFLEKHKLIYLHFQQTHSNLHRYIQQYQIQ